MRPSIIHPLSFIYSSIGPSKQHERETLSARGSEVNRSPIPLPPHPSLHSSTRPSILPPGSSGHPSTHPVIPHPSTHPSPQPSTHRITHSLIQTLIHQSLHPFITRSPIRSSAHPLRRLKPDEDPSL